MDGAGRLVMSAPDSADYVVERWPRSPGLSPPRLRPAKDPDKDPDEDQAEDQADWGRDG